MAIVLWNNSGKSQRFVVKAPQHRLSQTLTVDGPVGQLSELAHNELAVLLFRRA